jgi:hypothetical protein
MNAKPDQLGDIKPDQLRAIMLEIERDLAVFLPPVRERILKRVQAVYFLGAIDGLKNVSPAAERRVRSRQRHVETGTD